MMRTATAVWTALDPVIQAASIGAAATVIAASFGFGALFFQLRSQGRQSREAISENERRKLKAEMYQKAVAETRQLADGAIALDIYLRRFQIEVAVAAHANSVNLSYPLPSARYPELLEKTGQFMDAALQFIFTVENWRFLDPRIIVFRSALNVVLHDLREIFYNQFPLHVMPTMPTQAPDGTMFDYTPPPIDSAAKVKHLCDTACELLVDATSYTEDYTVELQNALLGDLFGTRVPHRVPLDPQSKVITLDRAEELERFFETSTAWGKTMAEVNDRTKASLAAQSQARGADNPE